MLGCPSYSLSHENWLSLCPDAVSSIELYKIACFIYCQDPIYDCPNQLNQVYFKLSECKSLLNTSIQQLLNRQFIHDLFLIKESIHQNTSDASIHLAFSESSNASNLTFTITYANTPAIVTLSITFTLLLLIIVIFVLIYLMAHAMSNLDKKRNEKHQ